MIFQNFLEKTDKAGISDWKSDKVIENNMGFITFVVNIYLIFSCKECTVNTWNK